MFFAQNRAIAFVLFCAPLFAYCRFFPAFSFARLSILAQHRAKRVRNRCPPKKNLPSFYFFGVVVWHYLAQMVALCTQFVVLAHVYSPFAFFCHASRAIAFVLFCAPLFAYCRLFSRLFACKVKYSCALSRGFSCAAWVQVGWLAFP